MDSPLNKRNNQDNKPIFMNIFPGRLNSLSVSELADGLESAMEYMTEEFYDPEVVNAYLEAMDAKVPVPEHPDANTAFSDLCQRIDLFAVNKHSKDDFPHQSRPTRLRHGAKVGLVAAVIIFCLFSSMVVAQAAGIDVFGAIARWTESVFSFADTGSTIKGDYPSYIENIPEEYKELQAALQERGLPLYFPSISEEFEVEESIFYIRPNVGSVHFNVLYGKGNDYIEYSIIESVEGVSTNYEKDGIGVESFEYDKVLYYIFHNNGDSVIAWSIGDFEYSLTSNLSSDFLKEIIQSDD